MVHGGIPFFVIAATSFQLWTNVYASLDCFECTNVTQLSDCRTTTVCLPGQNCYTERFGSGSGMQFSLGCKPVSDCQDGGVLVGRGTRARQIDCSKCCSAGYCNKQLCDSVSTASSTSTSSPSTSSPICEDDPDYNCALISGTFNICGDIHNAKRVCRKWCQLCDIVDGAWTEWSNFSACDITCGDGSRTRMRSCSNPAPSHGGLDCVGQASESVACHRDACPINGGWTQWSNWSGCSQSCGVGLQRRTRACSNPPPSLNGDHCFGDSVDNKVCFYRACADGNWGQWGAWSNCTAGLKSRSRACDSPAPSQFGRDCEGNSVDKTLCEDPSVQGQVPSIFFSVHSPNALLVDHHPTFKIINSNVGDFYNTTSGICTCSVSGLYHFSVTLQGQPMTYCFIAKNRHNYVYAETTMGGASVMLNLAVNDTVTLDCGGWNGVNTGIGTSYTGALIHI